MQSALLRHALMHIRDIVVHNTKNQSSLYIYCRAALALWHVAVPWHGV